jgi:uncharacterized protein YecE (DUF72 family)
LKEKTGCLLFQFPPNFHYTEENLEKIINSLDKRRPNVVEFRHKSWWRKDVYKILGENKISFSGMSHPSLPGDVIKNTSLFYYRMHGVPQLYQSPYALADLKKLVHSITNTSGIKKAFIYFNNDIGGSAIKNAKEMIELVK